MSDEIKTCHICDGDGTIETHKDEFGHMMNRVCPSCGGTGNHCPSPTESALQAERDALKAKLEIAMKALECIHHGPPSATPFFVADDAIKEIEKREGKP